jgi:CRP-like cAMP-binding protein
MATLMPLISEQPFLRSLPPEYLAILAECATRVDFVAGQTIFHEGDIADRFYLIQKGKVALGSHLTPVGQLLVQELGPGEVLGWSWLFPPYVWHFQAEALEKTEAISFNGAHLLIACERNHEFGYELMKRLTQILIRRLQATRKQLVNLHATQSRAALPSLK